ncbi:MAG: hypothetical protein R6U04_06770 [Bacteroidales bacterium]
MKKSIIILVFIALSLASFDKLVGQTIKTGGGFELRTNPPVSIMIKATYDMDFLVENLRTSVDMMFFPDFEGNLDFHYSFLDNFGFNVFGLAGMNIANKLGGNVGAGIGFDIIEDLKGFGEAKYIIKDNPEASIKIGVLYCL